MEKITPLGWVAIIFILLIAAAVNLWMVALLRNRDAGALNRMLRMKRRTNPNENMQKFMEVLRDPFGEERRDLQELSRRVKELKKPPPEP